MKTKRENGLGDDIVVSFTFDMPASYDEKALNVVYGNPSSVPTSRYYTKEKSGLDNENKVDVFLPLDGKLELHQEVNIDSIDLTKPVTCKLNYVDIGNSDKPITIEYNHSNEEKITFLKRLSNRQLSFEFDPDWVNRFVSSSLLYKDYSLELSFSLNLSRDIYSESVLFNVISKTNLNPDEKYYESITTELLVPPVNFYSETNELILTKPQMKKPVLSNDGISYINYGKPKTEGNPNHTFGGNKPNDKNEVKLLAPLNFIVELDNDKYPRGKFIGYNSDFEVKMSFGNTSYALDCTPADIQKMIIISSTGTTLTFNIPDDDWKQIVNAKTINESGEGVISFKFKMDVQASEIDKSTRTEVVNIDSSSTPVKVKFNSEEYEAKPQPEPMPEPTTRLVSPYNNGNEISIKLGNPKTPVANPTYSYAATPDKDNNIGLFSPFGFTMELDKGRFANSVFKGISGNPLIEMSISSIGTKRYDHSSSEIAGCVIISGEGKKLDFNLKNTDWNQKVNSASLNSANCTLNISFMIEMETTEKDGTKRSDKVKVETNTLNIKNIKYNAQEYEEVKPEPIPVPKNILVSPKGAGEIVKINLGNPSSAGSPDYTYSNNK
ncbi:MAG: hypothetical protein FWD13_11790, partial [Treponema sp.]|nr:hypothetical protein [Treponema sp.]